MSEAVDHQVLAALSQATGDDPAFLAELIDTYLADAPDLLVVMRDAVAAHDAAELRRAAHTLKSSGATFGAVALTDLSRQLESLAGSETLEGAAELIGRMEAEYERVRNALETVRERGRP